MTLHANVCKLPCTMEGSSLIANIKAEQEAQQVISPTGASVEVRGETTEEIAMIQEAGVRGQAQVTGNPTLAGYQTIPIPEALAASIFGQITNKEIKA
jgi:hypothetical protein